MSARRTKCYLDKQNGKFMGVCAGIADYTGIDVVWVRVAMFLSFFIIGWTLPAYFAIGVIADNKQWGPYAERDDEKFWQGVRDNPVRSTSDVRSKLSDLDERHANNEDTEPRQNSNSN